MIACYLQVKIKTACAVLQSGDWKIKLIEHRKRLDTNQTGSCFLIRCLQAALTTQ